VAKYPRSLTLCAPAVTQTRDGRAQVLPSLAVTGQPVPTQVAAELALEAIFSPLSHR